jgi:hypothetical protein
MKRVSFLNQHLLKFIPLAILGASFLLTLSGCPGGAELEHPEAYGLTGGSSTSGTGGSGTGGGGAMLTVDCGNTTYDAVLNGSCVSLGCHKADVTLNAPAASGLDLTPDSGLVGRIKDVKAQHGDITCPDLTTCVPATCDTNALLVNSSAAANSWILAKINGNSNGCGSPMPVGSALSADRLTCLENFVNAVAALPK